MESTDQVKSEVPPPKHGHFFKLHFVLRLKLFVHTLIALIVMVRAKQTTPAAVPRDAKFNYSPALIYFVAALSVACLYSIFSALVSHWVIRRPAYATKFLIYFTIYDVLMLGMVAAATSAAGGVAYIVLKGNSHFGWTKLCPVYDTFCGCLGTSLGFALLASVVLVSLLLLSVLSLYRRIPPPALD